jgi:iron(III) transport system substrate-binding protein
MDSPVGFPPRDQIKLLPFDAAKSLENAETDKETFAEIFN